MKASNPLFDRDQGNWSSRKSIDRSPTRVAKSNRICNKKQNKKKPGEIIKSWWWCCVHLLLPLLALSPHPDAYIFYSVSLASSRPVSFAPRFTTSLWDELSWFCFTFNIFFLYFISDPREGKEIKEQMIFDWNWMIEFVSLYFVGSMVRARVSTLDGNFQCYKVFVQMIFLVNRISLRFQIDV